MTYALTVDTQIASGAPEMKDDDLAEPGSRVSVDAAELAAGALVWASDLLLDELFQDAYALAEGGGERR